MRLLIIVLLALSPSTLAPRHIDDRRIGAPPPAGAQQSVSFLESRIRAGLAGLTIGDDGAAAIKSAVSAAASRYSSDRRSEAEGNADKLAQGIRTRARQNSGTVTADVVTTSLRDLCPLWPFCD